MISLNLRRIVTLVFGLSLAVGIPFAGAAGASHGAQVRVGTLTSRAGSPLSMRPLTKAQEAALARDSNRRVIILLRNQGIRLAGRTHQLLVQRARTFAAIQRPLIHQLSEVHATHLHAFSLINAVSATLSASEVTYLRAQPGVRAVVPDLQIAPPAAAKVDSGAITRAVVSRNSVVPKCARHPILTPEALGLTNDAFLKRRLPQAQNYEDGAGVTVAFIADGIDPYNPDFIRPNGTPVFTYYADFTGNPGGPTDGGEAFGDASSIAAQGNETYDLNAFMPIGSPERKTTPCPQIKILGMAPGASLMGLVTNFTTSSILQAIQFAVANGAQVLNESFGGNPYPDQSLDPISLADAQATSAGVTVVVSSGDAGTNATNGSPSTQPGVIAVGATTQYQAVSQLGYAGFNLSNGKYLDNNISAFSSGGVAQTGLKTVDVVAPGEWGWAVCSTNISIYAGCANGFTGQPSPIELFGGTSESAPLTSGEAALVIEAYRTHHHSGGKEILPSPAIVKQIIMSSATDLHLPTSEQGAGLINALKAVRLAESYGAPDGSHVPTGEGLAISANNCTTAANNQCNLALSATAAPGTAESFPVTVTNYGQHTQRVNVALRTLSTTPLASATDSVTLDAATDPTYVNNVGALRPYTTQTFSVPAGSQYLKTSIGWDVGAHPRTRVFLILFDPTGAYADYSIPQGTGNGYGQSEIHDPMAGTWKAVLFTLPTASPLSYSGQVNFTYAASAYTSIGTVTPASARLAPGASRQFMVSTQIPNANGDSTQDLVINGTVSTKHKRTLVNHSTLPVILRSVIPIGANGGTFSGSFLGGNARAGAGNQQTFLFNVPAGLNDLALGVALKDNPTDYNLEGVLINPSGTPIDVQSNATSLDSNGNPTANTNTLQFFRRNPEAGLWTFLIFVNGIGGPLNGPNEAFTGTIAFNSVSIQTSGLPAGGSSLQQGVPLTGSVTITNTGNTTENYFIDPRLTSYEQIGLGGGPSAINPVSGSGFLVPPETNSLWFRAEGSATNVPVHLDLAYSAGTNPDGFLGTPELFGNQFTDQSNLPASDISYAPNGGAAEVPFGFWFATYDELNGPYTSPSTPDTVTVAAVADTQQFDTEVTTSSGNLWGLLTGQTGGGFFPLTLAPSASGTINVTFTPSEAPGSTIQGHLYIDTVQIASGSATTNFSGDEIQAIPYNFTVIPKTG